MVENADLGRVMVGVLHDCDRKKNLTVTIGIKVIVNANGMTSSAG